MNNIFKPISINSFYLIISYLLILQTNRSLITDENLINIIILFIYLSLIIFIQFSFLIFVRTKLLKLFIFSIFITINILTLVIYIPVSVLILPIKIKLFLIPLVVFLVTLFFSFLIKYEKVNIYFKVILSCLLIFNFSSALINFSKSYNKSQFFKSPDYNIYDKIDFKKKINIHFFYFDSLTKNSEIKKRFDEEAIDYNDFLNKNFITFQNSFADAVPTNPSINSLFFLDPDLKKWLDHEEKFSFFNGIKESPLSRIFKNNNYKIAVGADYGSKKKGIYVDFDSGKSYNQNLLYQSPLFCNFRGKSKFLIFFSICYFYDNKSLNLNVIENLKKYPTTNFNWITINFLLYPAHAPLNYNHDDSSQKRAFKTHYFEQSKIATNLIKKIFNYINTHDENSILVILGDHGLITSISKKINLNNQLNKIEDIYLDRNTIQIAIYDKKKNCKEYYENKSYMTPILLMQDIINCLSHNELDIKNDGLIYDTLGYMSNPNYRPILLPIKKFNLTR